MGEKLYDLNNYWKLTKSQKIKRSDNIINMIAEMIDNNQYIKRFMRYYTKNPLANRIEDNRGETIKQPDLKDSLMENTLEVKSPNSNKNPISKRCLFTWGFNDDINIDEQNYIFIENTNINFDNYNKTATMYLNISILIPDIYLELKSDDNIIRRNKIIADTIDNMLGEYTVDNKYSKLLGNIQFELTNYTEGRLAKNSNKIMSILTYKTTYSTSRVNKYGIE